MTDAGGTTTSDTLLDGRVHLRQPAVGYRVAIDPVLLAAAVPARPGERVLDLGTGVGAAALCCAVRVPGCAVVGLELQHDLVELARANVSLNGLEATVRVEEGDVGHPPAKFADARFDHVMSNPPFAPAGQGTAPRHAGKRAANIEDGVDLRGWVKAAATVVRSGGTITLIHRADRLDELLAALTANGAGGVVVYPLWPKLGADCKRVLVQAIAARRAPPRLAAGLVLHEADGTYSAAAQAVLRGGAGLTL
ncbi:MAG: methyltransferase domain-containing protein [Alphaproteobacteria bacterium]|nr:methyltransferase domain-containing protein [Alphaproteobacteria bacterium]